MSTASVFLIEVPFDSEEEAESMNSGAANLSAITETVEGKEPVTENKSSKQKEASQGQGATSSGAEGASNLVEAEVTAAAGEEKQDEEKEKNDKSPSDNGSGKENGSVVGIDEALDTTENHKPEDGLSNNSSGNALEKKRVVVEAIPLKDLGKAANGGFDDDEEEEVVYVPLIERESNIEALHQALAALKILDYVCSVNHKKTGVAVRFTCSQDRNEDILNTLATYGIGTYRHGTKASVFPVAIHILSRTEHENAEIRAQEALAERQKEKSAFKEFKDTIKARLTVHQVVEGVRMKTQFSFDYAAFCVVASVVAALGLGEGNETFVIASMILSQLMGPILAITFGAEIRNWRLVLKGFLTELFGILICIIMGLVVGVPYALFLANGSDLVTQPAYPTPTMVSRTMAMSLLSGVVVAIMSGVGVALSVLNGELSSIIGVGISASLLPPAVNAGMLWSLSMVSAGYGDQFQENSSIVEKNVTESMPGPNGTTVLQHVLRNETVTSYVYGPNGCPLLLYNEFELSSNYCNLAQEAAVMGVVSLALTVVNILCIIIAGVVILKVKEFVPHTNATFETKQFWKNDIKVVRECYKTAKGEGALTLKQRLIRELGEAFPQRRGVDVDADSVNMTEAALQLNEIIEETAQDDVYRTITAQQGLPSVLSRLMSIPDNEEQDNLQTTIGASLPDRHMHTVHAGSAKPRRYRYDPDTRLHYRADIDRDHLAVPADGTPHKRPRHRNRSENQHGVPPPIHEEPPTRAMSNMERHGEGGDKEHLSPFSRFVGFFMPSRSASRQLRHSPSLEEQQPEVVVEAEDKPKQRFQVTKVPDSELEPSIPRSSSHPERVRAASHPQQPEQVPLLKSSTTAPKDLDKAGNALRDNSV